MPYLKSVTTPHIIQLAIGRPENHAPAGEEPWITAIYRKPVSAAVFCTKLGFEGDQVANRRVHGGPDKAVLCYGASNYPKWQADGLPAGPGGFGENLTIQGLDEETVCIGDVYRIGEVEAQVSQPRGPCNTLAHRWGRPDLVKVVKENHRSGWYLRILREGKIAPGDVVELVSRPHPAWNIAKTSEVNYSRNRSLEDVRELAGLPELSVNWRSDFEKKLGAMAGR
ncbi:MosC [Candidatus Koribacter versatilis Ellin345]|uniref:MosC n=1 Tax=Koribacter versatilis (strain Ellin345) TaxID=204669 RepID=Q1IJS3_KORVE|nr:MOSC domain-containing protein [Candidatus Koribacter versatilis]ABF42877.1 MosC [Candidatus Koribacter versatilis Ellin345]